MLDPDDESEDAGVEAERRQREARRERGRRG
jgi:hypothetical protein